MEYRIFGCKTNKYFTEKWLAAPGFSEKPGIFVASCVVTAEAKRKWVRFVKRAAAELPPEGKIYVSGCGSIVGGRVSDEFFDAYPELSDIREKIELLPEEPENPDSGALPRSVVRSDGAVSAELRASEREPFSRKTSLKIPRTPIFSRQYLVIQTGCDNRCTFCLTVAAR